MKEKFTLKNTNKIITYFDVKKKKETNVLGSIDKNLGKGDCFYKDVVAEMTKTIKDIFQCLNAK